ncbi:MAG: PQQ-binding-like beta-propeller repeat protein [Rickettsiaceae bacterium]|nr:PQQ-binding-like beta-propeller repeat protein [Rickettsiaceae bacterium]
MKKTLLTLLLPVFLSGCDFIGSGKTNNVVELTQKLKVEKVENIKLISSYQNIDLASSYASTSYNISKYGLIAVPAIAKKVVYSIDKKGYVTAFSLDEKKNLWSSKIDSSNFDEYNIGGILYSSGKLYITNGSREVTIMSANKGEKILSKVFPDIIQTQPIMIDDKTFIVQTISNQLIAFDTKKAEIIWTNEGEIGLISSRSHFSPILANGYVITSYNSGELFCLNAKNGDIRWVISLSDESSSTNFSGNLSPTVINVKPIIKDDYIYIATSNAQLMKIKIGNGDIIWKRHIEDIQSMSLSGNKLIITTNGRQVAILSTQKGEINWVADLINPTQKSKKLYPTLFQAPFVVHDNYNQQSLNIIASNGELYSFKIHENGVIDTKPEVVNIVKNIINYWISCCDNKIYLFNHKTVNF